MDIGYILARLLITAFIGGVLFWKIMCWWFSSGDKNEGEHL